MSCRARPLLISAVQFGVEPVVGVVGLFAAPRLRVHVAVTLTDSLVANLFGYQQFGC